MAARRRRAASVTQPKAQQQPSQRVQLVSRSPKTPRVFKSLPETLQARRAAAKIKALFRPAVKRLRLRAVEKCRPAKVRPIRLAVFIQGSAASDQAESAAARRQARMLASFLRACKDAMRKAERTENAGLREKRRKQAHTVKDELRKETARLDAEDHQAGRPAVGNRYQLLKAKA